MNSGICILPIIPMRKYKKDSSEMINQILFGETFKIIKKELNWSYVSLMHDNYKGWICNKQYISINNILFKKKISNKKYCNITISSIKQPLLLGSIIPISKLIRKKINISEKLLFSEIKYSKKYFINISKKYLNTPYLWGGRSTLGIDCSGYTQMVYKFFNVQLPRDSKDQNKKGKKIKSLSESKLGDLVFFTKKNKKAISHVGILLEKNKIIHASGKVKINEIDNKGIIENNEYTHILHSIKRLNLIQKIN